MKTEPNEVHNRPKLVTVFGGSGFVGRAVVAALTKRGYRVRVAVRKPEIAYYMAPLGNVGQIQMVQANVRHRGSVEHVIKGSDHVVNLVGILSESGRQRFNTVQVLGAKNIAEAAKAAGIRMTHVSSLAADANSPSDYARTKAEGEKAILSVLPDSVILRPSIIFGPEDRFFNRFANMARFSPFLPAIGGGETKLQPVYVGDVAEAVARAVDGKLMPGGVYELGGPDVQPFRNWMKDMLGVIARKRLIVSMPWWVARLQASILGLLPNPMLTNDQVTLLKFDNVVSEKAIKEGRTLQGMGITPESVDAVLPSYLWRYRVAGQYTKTGFA
ncbi:complex I NDUFA9 subunit family protein [Brucella intermedia]|jgi:NADH dehydrogenase|uniref:Complex I NDUFA9 subunit family protein n=1 Tax=Brucella ciceri TaxID=391287 RepID=A0ABX1DSF1_9HYPH|nr:MULTISPECIES: complex I NDUFA9 subunit family protein [Brucella/Ochrobactrum group]NKC27849.1 complex I NDUFA9 subunit family protein [Brucella ciceri]PJR94868.1 complex I NDUFA9 subunit family protein [Ochrobactrum sp. 721/2009]PJT17293.1 complex I NDUFA9 subunit family protein [Ochrobactrum sp. 720/2009]PJT18183.1 complex I NDUFA9 subunit family protein [Ochrobactrum sp. 715/2009]PJT27635.1 complex I NDUFA9 subunit family protein [Ochrobactrum sp. 30A/1000/2015]PJT30642.1 complex I NDUFA